MLPGSQYYEIGKKALPYVGLLILAIAIISVINRIRTNGFIKKLESSNPGTSAKLDKIVKQMGELISDSPIDFFFGWVTMEEQAQAVAYLAYAPDAELAYVNNRCKILYRKNLLTILENSWAMTSVTSLDYSTLVERLKTLVNL